MRMLYKSVVSKREAIQKRSFSAVIHRNKSLTFESKERFMVAFCLRTTINIS